MEERDKAQKWIGFVAEQTGEPVLALENIIFSKYGAFYPVFENIVTDSETTLKKLELSKKVAETLLHVAHENVKVPRVWELTGHLYLTSTLPNGISVIKRH